MQVISGIPLFIQDFMLFRSSESVLIFNLMNLLK
jgi:hypothetical protein